MKKIILLFLMAIFIANVGAYAQKKSDSIKPSWVTKELPDSKSDTYIFETAYAEARTLDEARQKALQNLSLRLEREHSLHLESGNLTDSEVCRVVDEYWQRDSKGYKLHVLYTIPRYMLPGYKGKLGNSYDDDIKVTSNYGAAGFMSIIPGVGQFYKGSYGKGFAFLSAEVVAAVGVVLCENNRASYVKKAQEQPKYMKEYTDRANQWQTARNITIGVAGAVYAWNIIDAFATKGARRVVVQKRNTSLSMTPFTTGYEHGVSFCLNF